MSGQYQGGKRIVKLSGMLFISAFVLAIATGNIDLSTYMVLASWLMFIVGGFMIGFSPEEKAKSAERASKYKAAYEQRRREAKLEETSQFEEKASCNQGPNIGLLGGIGALVAFPFMVILKIADKYKD